MIRSLVLSSVVCVMAAAGQPLANTRTSRRLRPVRLESAAVSPPRLILFDGPAATQTYPSGINNSGIITGFYADANGGHGFLRSMDGGFVTFDAPGSKDIYPGSINSAGAVAGNYGDTIQHGFLRTPDGQWITFDVPGTFPSSSQNPICINDSGTVAGPYFDGMHMHGFVRTIDGSLVTLDAPGSTYTYAAAIDAGSAIAGYYNDASFNQHGFVRGSGGAWITFDVPGNNFGFFPPALSINHYGTIVGSYFQGATHGFLRHPNGSLTTFDIPGAAATQPAAINSQGMVAGSYQDAGFAYHGFLRTPSGLVYTFSVSGAIGTFVVGINDNGAIAGSYLDASYGSHGFVLIP